MAKKLELVNILKLNFKESNNPELDKTTTFL